jgi:hypothetical protein
MVFRSHPIGACCMRSGRLQAFIPQKMAHFEEHILTLHTVCAVRQHATRRIHKRTLFVDVQSNLHSNVLFCIRLWRPGSALGLHRPAVEYEVTS